MKNKRKDTGIEEVKMEWEMLRKNSEEDIRSRIFFFIFSTKFFVLKRNIFVLKFPTKFFFFVLKNFFHTKSAFLVLKNIFSYNFFHTKFSMKK